MCSSVSSRKFEVWYGYTEIYLSFWEKFGNSSRQLFKNFLTQLWHIHVLRGYDEVANGCSILININFWCIGISLPFFYSNFVVKLIMRAKCVTESKRWKLKWNILETFATWFFYQFFAEYKKDSTLIKPSFPALSIIGKWIASEENIGWLNIWKMTLIVSWNIPRGEQ